MGRHKKKPDCIARRTSANVFVQVISCFMSEYDDRNPDSPFHINLRYVADKCGISILKARKILITAGKYSTEKSRTIQRLSDEGKSITDIMTVMHLSKASVYSYLPYKRPLYNGVERSVVADRINHYRERKRQCLRFNNIHLSLSDDIVEDELWNLFISHEGCIFYTEKGNRFRFKIINEKIYINSDKSAIMKSTVIALYHKLIESTINNNIEDNSELSATLYIYPIFVRFGIMP